VLYLGFLITNLASNSKKVGLRSGGDEKEELKTSARGLA
jgi:hypothetical protein